MVRAKVLGKSPAGAYIRLNEAFSSRLPRSVTESRLLCGYWRLIHALVRLQGQRTHYVGTFFFRNRAELELIRRLADDDGVDVLVLQPGVEQVIDSVSGQMINQHYVQSWDTSGTVPKYLDGTLPPAELLKDYRAAFINPNSKLLGPKFKFDKYGKCGAELSELLPHLATIVDDIAIVKSMVTDAFNHAPAQILMNTGNQQFGRPSLGSWITYGLGSESQDLPAFVVFSSGKKGPSGGNSNWGSGFLPTAGNGRCTPSCG
jgi:hypothetical protein